MPVSITKTWGATALPATVTDTQIGGAAMKAPEWAKELQGIKYGAIVTLPTSTRCEAGKAFLTSNDFSCQPSRVLWIAAQGSIAAASSQDSMPLEYWPYNYPIFGGSAFSIYMTPSVNAGLGYGIAMVSFGDGESIMRSFYDAYPHVSRFYEVCETGADKVCATADTALTALTITGVDPNVGILELFGYQLSPTITAITGAIGELIYSSNGFFTSPLELAVEVTNGRLGAADCMPTPPKVSRMDVQLPTSPTTIINVTYSADTTLTATDVANAGVCYKRAPV